MADQQRPLNPGEAPDPSRNYERSHPELESGMGRLDNNTGATPEESPDQEQQAVHNRQPPRQINADEVVDDRKAASPGESVHQGQRAANLPPPEQVDHSMMDEEPGDWDLAPTDIHDPEHKRHPRREGKGGTPDAGERRV